MASFCSQCGLALPESGVCPCTSEAAKAAPAAQEIPAPHATQGDEVKSKDQVDEVLQKTSALVGTSTAFLKRFAKQPVSAIQSGDIKFSEAILFAVLGFVAALLFIVATVERIISFFVGLVGPMAGPSGAREMREMLREQMPWSELFGQALIGYAVWLLLLIVLSVVFGKLICKAAIDFKKLFSLVVAAHIPMVLGYAAAAVLMFIAVPLSLIALVFASLAPIVLYAFALQTVFKTDMNKAALSAILAHTAMGAAYVFYFWIQLRDMEDIVESLLWSLF